MFLRSNNDFQRIYKITHTLSSYDSKLKKNTKKKLKTKLTACGIQNNDDVVVGWVTVCLYVRTNKIK